MSDERRRKRARASELALTPPATSLTPPSIDALRLGAPLVWDNPYRDAAEWAIGLPRRGLPEPVRARLDAISQVNVTAPGLLALAETSEALVSARELDPDTSDRVEDIGARARLLAGWLGHYPSMCIAMHAADIAAAAAVDDVERRLRSVTVAELSYVAHQQLLGLYRPGDGVHRRHGRDYGWLDLCARAENVEFMRRVDAEPALGPVRDDTGHDPRDRDDDRADRVVADLLDEDESPAQAEPGITVLRSVAHLPGLAKDGARGGTGSTPRAEFAGIAGVRLRCLPMPDLADVRAALVARHPHAAGVIDRVLGHAVGRPFAKLPPVLFVGPPGAGKTRLATDILTLMGLPNVVYACAGVADASFAGTSRQWGTGRGCLPLQQAKEHRLATVGLVLDEAEKCGESRHNGNLQDALLAMLDHADRYFDPYVETTVDLSGTTFLATANGRAGLTAPLLDRFIVLDVPTPGREHVPALVEGILGDVRRERGLTPDWLPELDGEELAAVQQAWRPGSIRSLRRLVEAVLAARETLAPRH